MPRNLEQVNRNLRKGAITSLIVLGLLFGGVIWLIAARLIAGDWRHQPALAAVVLLIIGWTLFAHGRGVLQTLGTRFSSDGLSRRLLGAETSLRWTEVSRLRFDARQVVLERRGAEPVVVSLMYAHRPDEVREALCALVPTAALRGPDA